jgi:hypothetical protein
MKNIQSFEKYINESISKYVAEIGDLNISLLEPILTNLINKNAIMSINDEEVDSSYSLAKAMTDCRMGIVFEKDNNLYKRFFLHMTTNKVFLSKNMKDLQTLNNMSLLYTSSDDIHFGLHGDSLERIGKDFKKSYIDETYPNFPDTFYRFHSGNYGNTDAITGMLDRILKLGYENMREWDTPSERDNMIALKNLRNL